MESTSEVAGHGPDPAGGPRDPGPVCSRPDEVASASALAEVGDADLIVFDGVCVLCSGFVRLVLRHDRRERFRFLAAQSPLGERLCAELGLQRGGDYETNLVFVGGRPHQKLDAFCVVMEALGWLWRALAVLKALPRPLADWLYDRIARNRYRLFGRRDRCLLPDDEVRARFLHGL